MKNRIFLYSLATAVLFGTHTFADGPFDKFIPRGRLLRKLRDDLTGKSAPQLPTPKKDLDQASQKGPTLATRPSGQQQQANHQGSNAKQLTRVNSGTDGFGMTVVVHKNKKLVVAQVAANGNAAEAGIKRGDVLIEAGGVELTAIEEFQQIAKSLGAGDQLELKLARRGHSETVMLQHGQSPSFENVETSNVGTRTNETSSSRSHQTTSIAQNDYQDNFSFVPPSGDDSHSDMQSVVERSTPPIRPVVSTQKPALSQLQSNYLPQPARQSQRSTLQQQQQIQVLREQLEQLRRQQTLTGSGLQTQ